MIDILTVSIGAGLVVSLLFSELFGVAGGGMVVPGYVALHLHQPVNVVLTIAAALATYFVVHMLSLIVILFGKRRTVITILVGYLLGMLTYNLSMRSLGATPTFGDTEFGVIGYIIPGLIAIWIDRQGLIETISTLLTASVVVRLVLILIYGKELVQ